MWIYPLSTSYNSETIFFFLIHGINVEMKSDCRVSIRQQQHHSYHTYAYARCYWLHHVSRYPDVDVVRVAVPVPGAMLPHCLHISNGCTFRTCYQVHKIYTGTTPSTEYHRKPAVFWTEWYSSHTYIYTITRYKTNGLPVFRYASIEHSVFGRPFVKFRLSFHTVATGSCFHPSSHWAQRVSDVRVRIGLNGATNNVGALVYSKFQRMFSGRCVWAVCLPVFQAWFLYDSTDSNRIYRYIIVPGGSTAVAQSAAAAKSSTRSFMPTSWSCLTGADAINRWWARQRVTYHTLRKNTRLWYTPEQ